MIAHEAGRYLLAGGANTALSWGIYLLLLLALDYRLAYVLAFVAGIGLSFVFMRHLVFGRPGRRHSLALVAAAQCLQLLLGLVVVQLWVAWLGGPQWLAPLVAVVVCTPIMFALQRWIFTPHASA